MVRSLLPVLSPGGRAAPDPVGGPDARRVAREELARDEYRSGGPGVVRRFLNWLGHLFGGSHGPGGSSLGGHALLIFALLLLVVLAVIVLRAGVPRRTSRQHTIEDDPLAPVAAHEHRRRAAEYAAARQHALALREYLRAAIATIEERGVLPPRPGRTGAATAREAGPLLPGATDDLAAATTAFDEVWFGGRPAAPGDVDRARAAADAVARTRIAGDDRDAGTRTPAGIAVPQ